ncbi:MAG TPA: hypothetical protein VF885_11935 [Arthrobacter sp.]
MNAAAEGIVLRYLTQRMQESDRAVTRIHRDDLLPEGQRDDIASSDWAAAAERLIDAGRILAYKINDLPESLELFSYNASGYTTPEHLLGLLKKARGTQAEELRDYLDYQGVTVPQIKTRTPVTAAQKKRIDTAVRKLNEIRDEIADRNPDHQVSWYLDATDNLHVMVEPEGQMEPDQRYIAHQTKLRAAGGGDW